MHRLNKMALAICLLGTCQCSSPSGSESDFIDEVINSCFSANSYNISDKEKNILGYLEIPLRRTEDAVASRNLDIEIQSPICGNLRVSSSISKIRPKLEEFLTKIGSQKQFHQDCDYDCANREFVLIPFSGQWEKNSRSHSQIIIVGPVKFAEPIDFITKFGGISKVEAFIATRRIEKQILLESLDLN